MQPVALTVNVAAPVPDEFAVTLTGCGRFQLLDDSVTEPPGRPTGRCSPTSGHGDGDAADGDALSETPSTPSGALGHGERGRVGLEREAEPHDPQVPLGVGVGVGVAVLGVGV